MGAEPGDAGFLPGSRDVPLLALLVVGTAALFAITSLAARRHHALQRELAGSWYRRAEADVAAGRLPQAIEGYRNSLVYARDDQRAALRLAMALLAAGSRDEARSHLRTLWEQEPGNGLVNRELARLAARDGEVADAERHYHAAIYGVWPKDAEPNRTVCRFELVRLLLEHGDHVDAQAELIALAAAIPKDADQRAQVAGLMLRAGDAARALGQFKSALALDPALAPALAGAGRAAFQERDYPSAERYLRKAEQAGSKDPELRRSLDVAASVLASDPFARRLSSRERGARGERAFRQAVKRLQSCPPDAAEVQALRQPLSALAPRVSAPALRTDPELLESVMDLAFDVERAAAARCGPPDTYDQALLVLAQEPQRAEP